MNPAWIALSVSAAGLAALFVFAPLARAAENEAPAGHRSWQLWSKEPGDTEWRRRAHPLGQTACLLDMQDLTMKAPSGTRAACVRIEKIPMETKR